MLVRAEVVARKSRITKTTISDHFLLQISAREIAVNATPGQFVMVRTTDDIHPLLPRPFSIMHADENDIMLLIRIVGKGTYQLSKLKKGDYISLWGPLGNGFNLNITRPILVAGGVGIAPLTFAANRLIGNGINVEFHNGGTTKNDIKRLENIIKNRLINNNIKPMFYFRSFNENNYKIHFSDKKIYNNYHANTTTSVALSGSTIDGTYGHHGFVTDVLKKSLSVNQTSPDGVLACGPMGMLKAVARICAQHGVPCQVSLEAPMACGLGACLGCAIPAVGGGYVRACQEGPVFRAEDVDWERL